MPDASPQDRILSALGQFTRTINGIRTTHGVMMPIIADISIKADKSFEKYVTENEIKPTEEDGRSSGPFQLKNHRASKSSAIELMGSTSHFFIRLGR